MTNLTNCIKAFLNLFIPIPAEIGYLLIIDIFSAPFVVQIPRFIIHY